MVYCSSKDMNKKRKETQICIEDNTNSDKRRKIDCEALQKDDVTKHLVASFCSFIEREIENHGQDQTKQEFNGLMEEVKTALTSVYKLPEDDSLKVPISIEEIFFKDIRNDIRAEHELYIGNYPGSFKEDDVRQLFEENGIEVGAIRMKYDSSNFSKV